MFNKLACLINLLLYHIYLKGIPQGGEAPLGAPPKGAPMLLSNL